MHVDPHSGLLLPDSVPRRCGACRSSRFWQDPKGVVHCWDCVPPQAYRAKMLAQAKKMREKEQAQVDELLDEDEDIKDYNERHFGVRTS